MSDMPIEERFWSKVDKTGSCWLWTGCKHPQGYGRIGVSKKVKYAHRISWELHNGTIPEGAHVLHKCDVPCCVNPDHLFLGTHRDNMQDKIAKGRANMPKGERCGNSKLKEGEVWLIRKIHKAGVVSQRYIAKMFRVSQSTINNIVKNYHWKNV